MGEFDKSYFARRAAEEAELALAATDLAAAAAHRRLQRAYTERASIGERVTEPAEIIGQSSNFLRACSTRRPRASSRAARNRG